MGVQFDATPRSGVDSSGIAVSSALGLGGTVAVRVTVDDAVITSKQDAILAIGAIRREIQRQPYPAVAAVPVLGPYLTAVPSSSQGTVVGAKRMVSGYSGNVLNLRRASDDAVLDWPCATGSDLPDYAAILTWTGGANPFVAREYSQNGATDRVYATASLQPTLLIDLKEGGVAGIHYDGTSAHAVQGVVAMANDPQAMTLQEVIHVRSANGNVALWESFDGSAAQEAIFKFDPSSLLPGYNGGISVGGTAAQVAMRSRAAVIGFRGSPTERRFYSRETSVAIGASAKTAGVSLRFGTLGSFTQFIGAATRYGSVFWNTARSDAQVTTLQADLTAIFGVRTSFTKRVVASGDSIPAGVSSGLGYIAQMGLADSVELFNCGTPSKTQKDINTDYANIEGALYTSSIPCVLTIQGGTNDLFAGTSTETGASVYGYTSSLVSKAKTSGYSVVLIDVLPRTDGDAATGEQTQRVNYNSLVIGNAMTVKPNTIIQFSNTGTTMGALTAPNNSTLYADSLHPTKYGNSLLAPAVATAVNALP